MNNSLQLVTTDEEFDRLQNLVTQLISAFPQANITPTTIVVYTADLVDLPIDDLAIVFKQLRRSAKFLPTIAEIFEAIEQLQSARRQKQIEEIAARERAQREAPGEPMPADLKPTINAALSKMESRRMK